MIETQLIADSKVSLFGETYFPNINQEVFAKNSSDVVFDAFFGSVLSEPNELYIISGSDSGLVVPYLIRHFSAKRNGRQFVVIDFAEVNRVCNSVDLPSWITISTLEQMKELVKTRYQGNFIEGKVQLVKSIAASDKSNHAYFSLHEGLLEFVKEVSINIANRNDSKVFSMMSTYNLWAQDHSFYRLKGDLNQQPVLIIASGPSFDENATWIAENQSHFFIIAIARMAKALSKHNITPDIFVTIDPTPFSFDNSRETLLVDSKCILLYQCYSSPQLISGWPQEMAYIGVTQPWHQNSDKEFDLLGPTVSHVALQATILMGASEVYLTGVDFCFSGDKTHVEGSLESELGKNIFGELFTVETYAGQQAETEIRFKQSVDAMAQQLGELQKQGYDFQVFNLNENAAKVLGTRFCDRQNIELRRLDKASVITEMSQKLHSSILQKLNFLNKVLNEVRDIRKRITTALKLSQKLTKQLQRDQELTLQTKKYRTKIDKTLKPDGIQYVLTSGMAEFGVLLTEANEYSNQIEPLEEVNLYAHGMNKTLNALVPIMENSIAIIQSRILELNPNAPLEKIAKSWRQSGIVGRHRIWLDQHNLLLDENQQTLYDQLESEFLDLFDQEELAYKADLIGVKESLELFESRVLKTFDLDNRRDLEELESELSAVNNESDDGPLFCGLQNLVRGKLQELSGDKKNAIELYQAVPSKYALIANKALLALFLKLNNHEGVVTTFEKLSALSVKYLVNYSDYLKLHNQTELAFNVLDLYLSQNSEDLLAWVKYVKLLVIMDKHEVAVELIDNLSDKFGNSKELITLKGELKVTSKE